MVSRAVSAVTTPTPRTAAATTTSTSDWPPWACGLAALFDRTDESIHGRDHRDRDESDHEPDRDDEGRLEDGDGLLQPVVDLLGKMVCGALEVGEEVDYR